jgi:hypothetical protein
MLARLRVGSMGRVAHSTTGGYWIARSSRVMTPLDFLWLPNPKSVIAPLDRAIQYAVRYRAFKDKTYHTSSVYVRVRGGDDRTTGATSSDFALLGIARVGLPLADARVSDRQGVRCAQPSNVIPGAAIAANPEIQAACRWRVAAGLRVRAPERRVQNLTHLPEVS